jgi:hypothetical protein
MMAANLAVPLPLKHDSPAKVRRKGHVMPSFSRGESTARSGSAAERADEGETVVQSQVMCQHYSGITFESHWTAILQYSQAC